MTFIVTSTADNGNGSLRAEIQNANNNPGDDTIVFSVPMGSVINLTSGALVINPATAGDGLTIDAGNNSMTINAQNNTAGSVPAVNQGISRSSGTGDVKLACLTLENALRPQTTTASAVSFGGAVNDTGSGTLYISDESFYGNVADDGGAVAYHPTRPSNGSLVIAGSSFGRIVNGRPVAGAGNRATFQGGAVYYANAATSGSFQTSKSNYDGNSVSDPYSTVGTKADGGALFVSDTGTYTASILSSNFVGNAAVGGAGNGAAYGGAIDTGGSSKALTIDSDTFTGNAARGGSNESGTTGGGLAYGGAVYTGRSGSIAVSDTTLNGNTATGGTGGTGAPGSNASGGGLYLGAEAVSISNGTTFTCNSANGGGDNDGTFGGGDAQGGALYLAAGKTGTVFGLFESNLANGGAGGTGGGPLAYGGSVLGGAVFNGGNLALTLAGFYGNSATNGFGGGAYNFAGGTFTLGFDTVTGNAAARGGTSLYNRNQQANASRQFTAVDGTVDNWPGSF